jgi:protein-L-isoaspartate O-methyltransferase
MDPAFRARLERVYSEHPIAADAILDRVRRQRGSLDGIRERDLAEAPGGGLTDQNHVGGAADVRALAHAIGLERGSNVLDIGTGLGGTPRLLAEEFGCRCHGVELTPKRFQDAVHLAELVGLDELVTFTQGDFMSGAVPGGPFDVAIGQGALMHFDDLPAVLDRIAAELRPGGTLVVEDGVIVEQPSTVEERRLLDVLLHHWNGRFQLRADWPGLLDRAGFQLDRMDDLTAVAIEEFERLLAETRAERLGHVTPGEHEGWELGLRFLRSGRLGIARIIATLSTGSTRPAAPTVRAR